MLSCPCGFNRQGMYLEQLGITHVRNLTDVTIEADPHINFFFGANAAGKTAILEAVYLLARTKSFRSPRFNDVLQNNKQALTITAELIEQDKKIRTGLQKDKQTTQLKFAEEKVVKASEQARNIPLFVITSESHRILAGTPKERRHWLDWAMFHVEPAYIDVWKSYYLALRHRNALLRQRANTSQFVVWESLMQETTEKLITYREKYLTSLQQQMDSVNNAFFTQVEITQRHKPGDKLNEGFAEYLAEQRQEDIQAGYTRYGPHRTDILFSVSGQNAGTVLSRGRAKSFLVLLIAAQVVEYIKKTGRTPVLLVDDIAAELDENARAWVMRYLSSLQTQLFVNSALPEVMGSVDLPNTMFHVERGKVVKMVE